MEFDSQSQCSDEDEESELPIHYNSRYSYNITKFSDDVPPDILEAKTLYLLLPKNIPISRSSRLKWLLEHLDKTIIISNNNLIENSIDLEVISAIPRDENNFNLKCNKFLITYRTKLKFIAQSYRFVYCLDMSPSHANTNINSRKILFDEILENFRIHIEGLSKQFTVPGSTLIFEPNIFLTIMANTPFFISPAQQVILKGIQMTKNNVKEIIRCVENYFHMLEDKIAEACIQAIEKLENQKTSLFNKNNNNEKGIKKFDYSDGKSKIAMVTPDVNFVNMLRYSMLAIYLLPEPTLSHIFVITDGVVSMPDSNVMETMLHQLHYDSISVSFLKVGTSFHPHCGAGLIPYSDLLYFFAHSTQGYCIESYPIIVHDNPNNLEMNFYQETFLIWSFHNDKLINRVCDNTNTWSLANDRFYVQKLPVLLAKRQTETSVNISLILLLARRMREGFTVENIFYINGNVEVRLIHQWKSSIFIQYNLTSQWPPIEKNLTHFSVYVYAPYEFLHDLTCLNKKETKSVFRKAIIQRFWSRLAQISSGDLSLASQLSNFMNTKDWCTIPESVRIGLPVFTCNATSSFTESTKLLLSPRDNNYCAKFLSIWQAICQLDTNHWRKWFHTHKISLILTHDTPLPSTMHMSNCSSQRYQVVQCRQAVVALYAMLGRWSSFILIDNHTYLKLINESSTKKGQPTGFCIVRVTSKLPSAVLNLGFSTSTSGQARYALCDELKVLLSSLSYIPKSKESSCCVLLQKPLEKILIRYERVPNSYNTVVFPDGTQPPDTSSTSFFSSPVTGSLFTTLSRYLFHKRWIWSANYPLNPRLPDGSISRILNTLNRMRLKEGYHFAYSSSGIVTMVLELTLDSNASCIIQYVLFPPYYHWGDDFFNTSPDDEDMDESSVQSDVQQAELQMVTEVWIEPQYGKVMPNNNISQSRISYFNDKHYYQMGEAIRKIDSRCINVLLAMEHISLMCQNKTAPNLTTTTTTTTTTTGLDNLNNPNNNNKKNISQKINKSLIQDESINNDKQLPSESPWYPILTPRIEYIPFTFNPISILNLCQQTELLFSMLREEKRDDKNNDDDNKMIIDDRPNKLLLDNIFEHFSLINDRELELTQQDCNQLNSEIIKRHNSALRQHHYCPLSDKSTKISYNFRWKCFIKGISITHVILTFIPESVDDLKAFVVKKELVKNENNAPPAAAAAAVEETDGDDDEEEEEEEEEQRPQSRNSNISDVPINNKSNLLLCLPIYVYDCPLKLLVSAHVGGSTNINESNSDFSDDCFLDHRFKYQHFPVLTEIREKLKGSSDTESCSEDTDFPILLKNLKDHCNALAMTHTKCYVLSLFQSLHLGVYVNSSDVKNAMDFCDEEIIEINITDYITKICSHVEDRRNNDDEQQQQQQQQKIMIALLNEALPCSDLKNLHMMIKKNFFKLICQAFCPISSNGEYYYFRYLYRQQPEENEKKVNDSDDEAIMMSVAESEIKFKKCERDMSIYSEGPHLLAKTINNGLIDVTNNVSDVSPLFLHFVCTIRYNNNADEEQSSSNTSVRVIPTCLGELIQNLENPIDYFTKNNLHVTLDMFCLTLPQKVQRGLTEYMQQELRTTSSFCSESGFQRTISTTSEISTNSAEGLTTTIPLGNLTTRQKESIDKLGEEIKWLLADEICTSLLNTTDDPITSDTIKHVINHILIGHRTQRDSCKIDKIQLNFVFLTNESHEKFLEEFEKLQLPFGYRLCKQDQYYYVAKEKEIPPEAEAVDDSFVKNHHHSDSPLDSSYMNIKEFFQSTSVSQQSNNICSSESSSSITGSDDGVSGYDEDVSEEDDDDDDYNWLKNVSNRRAHLPNFWLILKIERDVVNVYFHCRFVNLKSIHVDSYYELQQAVCYSIVDLCKRVNQLLLLQSLCVTKSCHSLLEPDDSTNELISLSGNLYHNFNKGDDPDTSDDSEILYTRSMSQASLHLKNGYFSCPVVWEKLFILHPRLKTGPGNNKSGLSRGIVALKNILEIFAVTNRSNMFVYKDESGNVFYLRLYESFNNNSSLNFNVMTTRINFKLTDDSTQSTTTAFSRSPSIISLPLVKHHHRPNLANSDQSIASLVSADVLRPRVRSFGETSQTYDTVTTKSSRENFHEDHLILKVHGVTEVTQEVQCGLVGVLQKKLDDAVLDFLSGTLARNAMCPLTPEDVRFIQRPQKADLVIRCTVKNFALQLRNSQAFFYYLRQNLLQFLNAPKYMDCRAEYHFKDYTPESPNNNVAKLSLDNIFIYNQSQTPTAGNRGLACIVVALITNYNELSSPMERENSFESIFIHKNYTESIKSDLINDENNPLLLPNNKSSYVEFRLWIQGRINMDNLAKKLNEAVSYATWDIVMEYYLLKKPLCVEEFKDPNSSRIKKRMAMEKLNLDTEIDYISELDLNVEKNNIKKCVKNYLPKKLDAQFFPNRKFNKRATVHPISMKTSKFITYDADNESISNNENNGILSIVYSKFLPSWMEFGHHSNVTAVRKDILKLTNRHFPSIIVKELITMLSDSPKAFRALSTHSLNAVSDDIYVPFITSNFIQKYVIISRNFQKWKNNTDEGINLQHLKNTQRFTPTQLPSINNSSKIIIPRQKIFWISIENDCIVIYTYNWVKENVDKLIQNCMNLTQWLMLRSCFLNSITSQKIGLFHNQSLSRKQYKVINNMYFSLIGTLDGMHKFPRENNTNTNTNTNNNTHNQKKNHQTNVNLPMILESFRDNFSNSKYTSMDAVAIFTIEMREMKLLERKTRDEMKKLHSMYQSRTGSTSVSQLNLLMQNSRILHYVHTPLLFLPRWRIKSASTRDSSIYPSKAIKIAEKLRFCDIRDKELWHTELCYLFFSEYRCYLHSLGFTPLQIDNPQHNIYGHWKDKSLYNSVFYVQRTILGGILIFTVSFEEPFFICKLYAIECSRLQNITSRASINGFTLSFLDECDRIKILMHLHSFTYDYHLRSIYNYITGNYTKLPDKYNVQEFLDHFLKYYNKAPNFARNLVYTATITIDNLVTEGKQLFDYLLLNYYQYGFKKFEINSNPSEYVLVQVTTAKQVSYKDFQERMHTDDFDMTLVVNNLCTPYKPTEKILHLKYYLILTSRRDTYPMTEDEQKLGKFRPVSYAGSHYLLDKLKAKQNNKKSTLSSSSSSSSSLTKSNSCEETNAGTESTEKTLTTNTTNNNNRSAAAAAATTEEMINPITKYLSNITIMQESVNYLGYYSSHEQIMQQLILEKSIAIQKDIKRMVTKGMTNCRTSLLWNRMIAPQGLTPLTFDEFIELKKLAKLTPLSQLNPNLGSLLNQPLLWYQGLAKQLLGKYADQHRKFISDDKNIEYYVILHPRYYGAFMLLSIDLGTSRGELFAVYREPNKNKEDADPLGLGYEKSLRDGFVNCVCFYLWSGMICS